MKEDPELRRLLWHILGGARGGINRARIIYELSKRPSNINQLAGRLNVDFRTVQHHIEILRKNSLVISEGEHYGLTYFLSPWLESNMNLFEEICSKLGYKLTSNEQE